MSYPQARYRGEAGKVSASLRLASRPPELTTARGAVHYLATTTSTSGEFGLYRWEMGPEPSGPSPHFHKTISESFYVLTGTVRLFDGAQWIDAVPGDFLYVPPGGIHAFSNASGKAASMLLLFAPGAPREQYFEELEAIAASGRTLSPEQWTDLFARHDQYMV